mmetsp:Transcript_13900/g.44060  ORF Transcript_13900/g.44060 Transcript_13900/m.44060 type:complete len:203 (-) Transcript_13900:485-1093(-)
MVFIKGPYVRISPASWAKHCRTTSSRPGWKASSRAPSLWQRAKPAASCCSSLRSTRGLLCSRSVAGHCVCVAGVFQFGSHISALLGRAGSRRSLRGLSSVSGLPRPLARRVSFTAGCCDRSSLLLPYRSGLGPVLASRLGGEGEVRGRRGTPGRYLCAAERGSGFCGFAGNILTSGLVRIKKVDRLRSFMEVGPTGRMQLVF